jgi:hypothetical protein
VYSEKIGDKFRRRREEGAVMQGKEIGEKEEKLK